MITDQCIYDTVVERISKQDNYRLILEANWSPHSLYRYGNYVTPIGCFIPEEYYYPSDPKFELLQCRYLLKKYRDNILKTPAFVDINIDFLYSMNMDFAYINIPNEHNEVLKFLHSIGIKKNLVISEYLQNLMILI